jgi:hypothetical protein
MHKHVWASPRSERRRCAKAALARLDQRWTRQIVLAAWAAWWIGLAAVAMPMIGCCMRAPPGRVGCGRRCRSSMAIKAWERCSGATHIEREPALFDNVRQAACASQTRGVAASMMGDTRRSVQKL